MGIVVSLRDCVGVLYGYRSVIERLCRSVVWVS